MGHIVRNLGGGGEDSEQFFSPFMVQFAKNRRLKVADSRFRALLRSVSVVIVHYERDRCSGRMTSVRTVLEIFNNVSG